MNAPVIETIFRAVPWAKQQLRQYLPLLALPPLLCAGLAIAWVLVTPSSWKAYQSLLVRDDLLGENFKPGRFSSLENQKNAQETLLHVARKPEVIRGTLQALGPERPLPAGKDGWPSETDVDDLKDAISIVAPNGAEFGKTDVVVLSVKAQSRERAKQFVDLLAGQIELNLRSVRQSQLRSMQTELELAVEQLQREYDRLAQKVKQVELVVGSDLPVLRSLLDRSSSAGDVQRALEQIRQERRLAENELEVARKQLELLRAIETEPDQFAVSSSELLAMQPIFKKLREGLTDAELRLMTESGRYEPEHPAVLHAREVIAQTKDQIRREARAVIQGLQLQATTAEEKLNRLRQSEERYDQRLVRLGEQRVGYEILAREMDKSGETLGKAKTELAQIQSLADSADQISLITRIGEPQADLRPEGLSKKSMVLLAVMGGLLLGGGLVGLFYRPDPQAPWLAPSSAEHSAIASHPPRPLPPDADDLTAANVPQTGRPARRTKEVLAAKVPSRSQTEPEPRPMVARPEPLSQKPEAAERGTQLDSELAVSFQTGSLVNQAFAFAGEITTTHSGSSSEAGSGRSNPARVETEPGLPTPAKVIQPKPPGSRSPSPEELPRKSGSPSAANSIPRRSSNPDQPERRLPERVGAEPQGVQNAQRETPPPVNLPGKIDLAALKRELSEAAKRAVEIPTEERTVQQNPEPAAGIGLSGQATGSQPPSESAEEQARIGDNQSKPNEQSRPNGPGALTDRIDLLSRSIATFCDAIRIEPPADGSA